MDDTKPKIVLVPCRFDACEHDEPGEHGIPRDWHEDRFHQMLETIDCDAYGHAEPNSVLESCKVSFEKGDARAHYVIDTPLFTLRPYYWGDEREIYALPNFVYKPWSLEMRWYKWPMRDASANFLPEDADWTLMCETIERSVKTFAETGSWPDDIDDFPRMSEIDEVAWNLRKQTHRQSLRANRLEDLLFAAYMAIVGDEDGTHPLSQKTADEIKHVLGLDVADLSEKDEGDDDYAEN